MTSFEFVENYECAGIFFEDDRLLQDAKKEKVTSLRRGCKNLNKLVKIVSRISLLLPEIRGFRPSEIASSCVLVSR